MSISTEPNPPARREEDFPKTNTIPDGWTLESIMDVYNRPGSVYDPARQAEAQPAPVPATGADEHTIGQPPAGEALEAATGAENENLFTRRLEPFPSAYSVVGMWL